MTVEEAAGAREQGIYTTYAFISSSLSELAAEREALHRGLTAVAPHFYDHEHGAAFESHRDEWRHDLTRCHVYIGIYWKKLGPWTRDEFDFAMAQGKPMLLYFKGPYEWEGREEELRAFIAALGDVDRQGAAFFEDPPDGFARLVNADLEREKAKAFAASIERRRQVHAPGTDLTYTPTAEGGQADEAVADPPPAVRRSDVGRLEPFDGEFLDREEVLEELLDALEEDAEDELIELVGPKGMGKGALLERLVQEDLDQYPDGLGVNPVGASLDDFDDLLRTVFEAFYESTDPEVVTAWSPETLRAHLAGTQDGTEQIRALVVFEDVPPGSEQFADLRKALPKSLAVCVTTEEATGEGLDVPVEGFEDAADVLGLFELRYKAPIPEKAQEFVLAACAQLGNAPGAIRELGRLASREAKPVEGMEPLVAWARVKAVAPPTQVLTRGGAAKEAVKALVAAGGEAPAEVIGEVAGAAGASAALAAGIIEPGSPRYRLASVVTRDIADAATDMALMDAILESAVGWAARARLDEIVDDRAFVQRMTGWGVLHGRYEEALALARAADGALAMGLRWGAWERVLLDALASARALNRPCDEGWARHQLGTRALLLGDRPEAREHLAAALDLRRAYCNPVSVRLSEHNLALATDAPRPLPPAVRLLPGLLAVVALLVIGLCGPRGGISDFDVPFGAVQVTPGEAGLQLFRLGPDEYRNDQADPLDVTITLAGDPEFCVAIAGIDGLDGVCVPPGAAGSAAGRAPPAARGGVAGMPLAQAGGGCEITPAPGAVRLSIPTGASCPVLFGFAPPDQPGLELAAEARFVTGDGARWRGRLSGSTFAGAEVVTVAKVVDADGDGAFAPVEQRRGQGGLARFEVTVRNASPTEVVLLELADNRYGDLAAAAGSDCRVGDTLAPGAGYSCRFDGTIVPTEGARFVNIVTATVGRDDERFSASARATVLLDDPDAAVVVTKTVDADGDGRFAPSERFAGRAAGPAEYEVRVENRGAADVRLVSLTDDAFGDLATLPATSCTAGVAVAPGATYACRFTADVDPGAGEPHRNVVEVVVDPPLDSPYAALATVAFDPIIEVTKSVDADGDGEFRPSEPLAAAGEIPFRVAVRNLAAVSVDIVAVTDDEFGDVTGLPGSTCTVGTVVPAGSTAECVFLGDVDVDPDRPHQNVVTVTVAAPDAEVTAVSNPVVVPVVLGGGATATLTVDADGDGAFAAAEVAAEGAARPVTFRISVNQPAGTAARLGEVAVAPFGDVAGLGDCSPGAAVDRCEFTVEVGGNAGDAIEAVLDTDALISQPGGAAATVTFTDVAPALTVAATGPATASRGDRIPIAVTVRNGSGVTDPVTLSALTDGAGAGLAGFEQSTCAPAEVSPGATLRCTFLLPVTAAPGGTQSVSVIARGADDDGTEVVASGGHSFRVAPRVAAVEISKWLDGNADEDGDGRPSPGDTLTFRLRVLNGGAEPLSAVVVTDPLTGFIGTCGQAALAAGTSATCTTSYVVTTADADRGEVVNTASVSASAPSGPVAGSDVVTVPVPVLTISKQLPGRTSVIEGDLLTFVYAVTARSVDTVTVTDPLPGLGPITCPAGNPGPVDGEVLCTADYVVTQADAEAGEVASTARVTGTRPGGQAVVATDDLAVPVAPAFVVAVETDPPAGTQFTFGGAIAATLTDGAAAARSLPAGTYEVTADGVPANWTLTAIGCDDADSVGDVAGRRATYRLGAAERVTCTFTFSFGFAGTPVIDAEDEILFFGVVPTGTTSVSQPVRLRNIGNVPVTIAVAVPSDVVVDAADCAGRIGPGGFCTLQVAFAPAAPGAVFRSIGLAGTPAAAGDDSLLVVGTGSP